LDPELDPAVRAIGVDPADLAIDRRDHDGLTPALSGDRSRCPLTWPALAIVPAVVREHPFAITMLDLGAHERRLVDDVRKRFAICELAAGRGLLGRATAQGSDAAHSALTQHPDIWLPRRWPADSPADQARGRAPGRSHGSAGAGACAQASQERSRVRDRALEAERVEQLGGRRGRGRDHRKAGLLLDRVERRERGHLHAA
jgi:hypothetical protein